MLKRYAHRLAVLEARFRPAQSSPALSMEELTTSMAGYGHDEEPKGCAAVGPGMRQDGRSPDDETEDLAAEVEALERRRQELETDLGETA